MARIAGVNLPNQKRLEIGLTYIFGIGQPTAQEICDKLGLSRDTKVRDLTEDEVAKLRDLIDQDYQVEGDLRRERTQAIKRLQEIGSYRGLRHRRNLPRAASAPRRTRAPRARRRPSGAEEGEVMAPASCRARSHTPPHSQSIAIGQAHIKTSPSSTIVALTDKEAT